MQQRPTYGQGDTVWVNRGGGVQLHGTVVEDLTGTTYRVAVADQGVRVIGQSALSPREPASTEDPSSEPEAD